MSVSKLVQGFSGFTNVENPGAIFSMWSARIAIRDCALLSLILFFSFSLYVWKLGFYSDDWAFLAYFTESNDQSIGGLYHSASVPEQNTSSLDPLRLLDSMRPLQIYYFAFLYKLFGLNPLGYHLFNSLVLCVSTLYFYLGLREMREPRIVAFTLPLIWSLMPHYSSNRFWYIAAGSFLSQAFYFLSLYADLKSLRVKPYLFWVLRITSLIAILLSALTYEVTLPLFFLNLLAVLYTKWKLQQSNEHTKFGKMKMFVLIGTNILALVGIAFFKIRTAIQYEIYKEPANRFDSILRHFFDWTPPAYGISLRKIIAINYWDYGIALPRVIWKLMTGYPSQIIGISGVIFLFFVAIILYRLNLQAGGLCRNKRYWLRMILLGILVTGFGYAIFLGSAKIQLTPTGIGNRVNIAAAIGVAMSFLGAIGLFSAWFRSPKLQRLSFCGFVAFLCSSYFLINNILASYWVDSYQEQKEIIKDIQQQAPELPDKTIVILNGICSYRGSAVVFESYWDFSGALKIFYHNPTLRADVTNKNMIIGENGIQTTLYGWITRKYDYDENLLVFDYKKKAFFKLNSKDTAHHYFDSQPDAHMECPQGAPGAGVRLF